MFESHTKVMLVLLNHSDARGDDIGGNTGNFSEEVIACAWKVKAVDIFAPGLGFCKEKLGTWVFDPTGNNVDCIGGLKCSGTRGDNGILKSLEHVNV